jgi:hypothetical protein
MILNAIQLVEAPLDARVPVHCYHSADLITALDSAISTAYPTHDSYREINFYLVRAIGALSLVVLLFFLFYHD